MKAFRLDGYAVLVTGAGSGMGRAMAVRMAEAGAQRLFLCGRRRAPLEETAGLLKGATPHILPGDVRDAAYRKQLVAEVAKSGGRLDTLVNNAGLFTSHDLAATSDDEWRDNFDVNVTAPFALTRELLPHLGRGASVLNISSTLAVKPIPNTAAYNAAKGALIQLTRSLAVELGPRGVRVNCVLPAIVETPMYRDRYDSESAYDEGMKFAATLHPIGRVGQPDDVAYAAVYLASPAASWITGVGFPVDGGMLCT